MCTVQLKAQLDEVISNLLSESPKKRQPWQPVATTLIRKVEHWTAVSRIPASMRLEQDLPVGTENLSKSEDHRESGGLLLSTKCVSYFNDGW